MNETACDAWRVRLAEYAYKIPNIHVQSDMIARVLADHDRMPWKFIRRKTRVFEHVPRPPLERRDLR